MASRYNENYLLCRVDRLFPRSRPRKRPLEDNFQPVSKKVTSEINVSVPAYQYNFNTGANFDTNKTIVQTEIKIPDTCIEVSRTDDFRSYIDHLQYTSGAKNQFQRTLAIPNALDISGQMQFVSHAFRQMEEVLNYSNTKKRNLMKLTFEIPNPLIDFPDMNMKSEIIQWIQQKSGAYIELTETFQKLAFRIMGHEGQIKFAKSAIENIFPMPIDLPYSTTYLGERYYETKETDIPRDFFPRTINSRIFRAAQQK